LIVIVCPRRSSVGLHIHDLGTPISNFAVPEFYDAALLENNLEIRTSFDIFSPVVQAERRETTERARKIGFMGCSV
jgi:hypothetical protein